MKILAIDIGGTNVKMLATGQTERRKFPSGRTLTPKALVAGVTSITTDWQHDVVSIGYPGRVRDSRIIAEPKNLGPGWVGFDFAQAFGCPVKIMNDAAMQALGSYRGGALLFIGLGTGLGSALVVDGTVVPLELGKLAVRKLTFESYLGVRALKKNRKKWQRDVHLATTRFASALDLDDVVLGGGNAKKLLRLPDGCRLGDNANAFIGGYRLWEQSSVDGARCTSEFEHQVIPSANTVTLRQVEIRS